eukprot:1152957-Pelagomonas_calceolata.AAC.2
MQDQASTLAERVDNLCLQDLGSVLEQHYPKGVDIVYEGVGGAGAARMKTHFKTYVRIYVLSPFSNTSHCPVVPFSLKASLIAPFASIVPFELMALCTAPFTFLCLPRLCTVRDALVKHLAPGGRVRKCMYECYSGLRGASTLHGRADQNNGLRGLLSKKQVENGRRTENAAKAGGRQAKNTGGKKSRPAQQTQQPRQAEHARGKLEQVCRKRGLDPQHKGESKTKPR